MWIELEPMSIAASRDPADLAVTARFRGSAARPRSPFLALLAPVPARRFATVVIEAAIESEIGRASKDRVRRGRAQCCDTAKSSRTTARPFAGCTGRLFSGNALDSFSICGLETAMGCVITN